MPDKHGLSHGMCLYQVRMTLYVLNDVRRYDGDSTQKIENYVIIASLKCETLNRIPGSRLLISSLPWPGSALRTHVEWLCKPRDVNKRSQNLISKDTHLVFSLMLVVYADALAFFTRPRSAVRNVSGNRCESACGSRGREFDPGPVPYFRGD